MTLENSMYEPEQFPGMIYRMRDPKNVVLIFGSGKFVIVGAKSEEQVPEAARRLMSRILELDLMQNWEVEEDG
jgi:transcription initiation factor TFIID TATA-box-binding protein